MSNFKPIITIGTDDLEIDFEYQCDLFEKLDDRYLPQLLDTLCYFIFLVEQEQRRRADIPVANN